MLIILPTVLSETPKLSAKSAFMEPSLNFIRVSTNSSLEDRDLGGPNVLGDKTNSLLFVEM